jgi:signal transduction histidine kinase
MAPDLKGTKDTYTDMVVLLLCLSYIFFVWKLFETRPQYGRLAIAIRLTVFLCLCLLFTGWLAAEIILLGGLVVEVSTMEEYPANLAICGGIAFFSLAVQFLISVQTLRLTLRIALLNQLDYASFSSFFIVATSLAAKYRKSLLGMKRETARLEEMAVALTKLNFQYQSVASNAAEIAMLDERKRITRDVHDIVGYTLTNNIAMMEAATDMMRRNPIGVPALINAARENAEEGLQRIREALYRLRGNSTTLATGLHALTRLCKMFDQATGISVRFEYGNSAWSYGEISDSAIYHLVQEALINSFRHGRANHITIVLSEAEGDITLAIADDGKGASDFEEGIGLAGMRERIECLGGSLRMDGLHGGFSLLASIPKVKVERQ